MKYVFFVEKDSSGKWRIDTISSKKPSARAKGEPKAGVSIFHPTKQKAVEYATRHAKDGGTVVIRDLQGKLQEIRTYPRSGKPTIKHAKTSHRRSDESVKNAIVEVIKPG